MNRFISTDTGSLHIATRQQFMIVMVVITSLFCSSLQAEPQDRLNQSTVQLALKPEPAPGDKPAQQSSTKRPPEVEILRSIDNGGGTGFELHRVTITGTARNANGDLVKNATIYVGTANRSRPGDLSVLRGQTQTDDTGHYELKDIQLLVLRTRPNPIPQPTGGGFVIFGTCEGYGFTWHETCQYRPDVRPQATEVGDKNADVTANAFYLNEPIVVDLMFEKPALLRGRITDKQGHPLANTKVQLGLTDSQRNPSGYGIRSCRFLGNENQPVKEPVSFSCIKELPAVFRETRTDAEGYYEFKQLRRDCNYLANISPGPEFDSLHFNLVTAPAEKVRNKREVAVGYDGEFNREFTAPQNVTVQVVQEQSGEPVGDVLITARPIGEIRHGGIQARSDSQGNARLHLLPGEYKLITEPAPDQPFHYQSQQFFVKSKPHDVQHTVKLRPAAIVILKAVDARTGKPLPGVRFNYETDTSSEPLPVSTQTVYVDFPKTNAAGEIQTVVIPGQRRFVVAEPLTLAQSENSRGEMLQLTPGEVTTVEFKLSTPQFVDAEEFKDEAKPDPESIYPVDLQLKWHHQSQLLRNSGLRITTRTMRAPRLELDTEGLLKELRRLEPDRVPDIDELMKEYQGQGFYSSRMLLTSKGRIRRQELYFDRPDKRKQTQENRQPDSIAFRDDWETLRYDTANNQASASRSSFLHIASPFDFTNWPSLRVRRPAAQDRKKPEVTIQQTGPLTTYSVRTETDYRGKKQDFLQRRVVDRETGFIFENYIESTSVGLEQANFYFAPQKLSNGLILPRFHINWKRYQGKMTVFSIYKIEKVELFDQLPADAFTISIPAGASLVDSRHIPPGASRRGPVRRIQRTLTGPVTDFAAYLQRHPRFTPELEQKVHYGRPAPEIKPASWVTHEGSSDPPDTKDKVVLIEFWGTHCGPCIANLPEVQTAARFYADQPFVLIGMHDSHISIPELQKFAQKNEIDYQLAIDRPSTRKGFFGETIRDFNVRGIPTAAVIDQEGNLSYIGQFSEALKVVDRLLKDNQSSTKAP